MKPCFLRISKIQKSDSSKIIQKFFRGHKFRQIFYTILSIANKPKHGMIKVQFLSCFIQSPILYQYDLMQAPVASSGAFALIRVFHTKIKSEFLKTQKLFKNLSHPKNFRDFLHPSRSFP